MTQLAVIIACHSRTDLLEKTLVSVLQNRPRRSEILVSHTGCYQDPYDLGDEVQFLSNPQCDSIPQLFNAGLKECGSKNICLLTAGIEVGSEWEVEAIDLLNHHDASSVTPLLVDSKTSHVAAMGVQLSPSGQRTIVGRGKELNSGAFEKSAVGPTIAAGFFQRSVLDELDGFSEDLGGELADVDLALRIAHQFPESNCALAARVPFLVEGLDCGRKATGWEIGCHSQRLLNLHPEIVAANKRTWNLLTTAGLEILTGLREPSRFMSAIARWKTRNESVRQFLMPGHGEYETQTLSFARHHSQNSPREIERQHVNQSSRRAA